MHQTLPVTKRQRQTPTEYMKHAIEERMVACSHGAYDNLDWEHEVEAIRNPTLSYPDYYLAPHHGITEGYLSNAQAMGWAFIERLFRVESVLPGWLALAGAIPPKHIIDLGCGTATASIALAQRFPEAHLTLIDLSPYQLVAARRQAQRAGLAERTTYIHATAEYTNLPDESADLVMSTLLFHELPRPQAYEVVREAYRLLTAGGRFVEFDPIQHALPWHWADMAVNRLLAKLIHEVYWLEYMQQPLWEVCQNCDFQQIERKLLVAFPWVYQTVIARK